MSDLDDATDKLRLALAETPEERAYAKGWIGGKHAARKEIALLAAFLAGVALLIAVQVVPLVGTLPSCAIAPQSIQTLNQPTSPTQPKEPA